MPEPPDVPDVDRSVLAGVQPPPRERAGYRLAVILIVPLTLAAIIIGAVFYVIYRPVIVDGESMLPALRPEDRLLVTRSYDEPVRGDIVSVMVVDGAGNTDEVVKRVVAVPGDTIEIRDDIAYVNGAPESGITTIRVAGAGMDLPPEQLTAGDVYLLGDNRAVSLDSRLIGPVRLEQVRGRAVAIFAPLYRAGPVR